MIRPEHPFDIRPDLRKAASIKAESTKAIKPKGLNRIAKISMCLIYMDYI